MVKVGDIVEFKGEDSQYSGVVVAVFNKINGTTRCVVEDERGLLLIKNPKNAKEKSPTSTIRSVGFTF